MHQEPPPSSESSYVEFNSLASPFFEVEDCEEEEPWSSTSGQWSTQPHREPLAGLAQRHQTPKREASLDLNDWNRAAAADVHRIMQQLDDESPAASPGWGSIASTLMDQLGKDETDSEFEYEDEARPTDATDDLAWGRDTEQQQQRIPLTEGEAFADVMVDRTVWMRDSNPRVSDLTSAKERPVDSLDMPLLSPDDIGKDDPMNRYESLDYEQSVNVPFLRAQVRNYLGPGDEHSSQHTARTSINGTLSGHAGDTDGEEQRQRVPPPAPNTYRLSDGDWGLSPLARSTEQTEQTFAGWGLKWFNEPKKEDPRKAYGYTGRTLTRWIITWAVGLVTGLIAYTISKGVSKLIKLRNWIFFSGHGHGIGKDPCFLGWLGFTAWNLVLVLIASTLCLWYAPGAAGSGIPEVKAYLNGVRIKHFFSFSVFWVKLAGTILGVASNLMVGPEGPLVHLGSIVGSGFTSGRKVLHIRDPFGLINTKLTLSSSWLMRFRSDTDRRDFISTGAAAGFSAAFGAPIGGVLFALEEACSFWSPTLMWRTLTATLLAIFTLLVLENVRANHTDSLGVSLNEYGLISLETGTSSQAAIEELPLFAILGVLGGFAGALFNWLWDKKQRWLSKRKLHRLRFLLGVSVFTSSILYLLVYLSRHFSCEDKANFDVEYDDDGADAGDSEDYWLDFGCHHANQTNVLASVFFSERETSLKKLMENGRQFSASMLAIMFAVLFPLMILTFALALPCGVFMPTLLCGAIGGLLFGRTVVRLRDLYEWTYLSSTSNDQILNHTALIGAVALLGGIQRSTLSLCVIIMEGTGQVQLLLPIIATTVMARYVGNHFNKGLYELALDQKHIPFLEAHVHHNYYMMRVSDVMQYPVQTLRPVATVREVCQALRGNTHNGFPVVTKDSKICGLILRSQLRMMLRHRLFMDIDEPVLGNGAPQQRGLRQRSPSIDEALQVPLQARHEDETPAAPNEMFDLKPWELECKMNIMRIMNQGPHVVLNTCPVSRAYNLFISVGLRHLIVIDFEGKVVGIVTRKDLVNLEQYKPVRAYHRSSLQGLGSNGSDHSSTHHAPVGTSVAVRSDMATEQATF